MKKSILTILVSLLFTGCSNDYSVELKNGYFYNHWGNNFISRKVENTEQQIIKGQIKNYVVYENIIAATRYNPSTPNILQYLILDMNTHKIEILKDHMAFTTRVNTFISIKRHTN